MPLNHLAVKWSDRPRQRQGTGSCISLAAFSEIGEKVCGDSVEAPGIPRCLTAGDWLVTLERSSFKIESTIEGTRLRTAKRGGTPPCELPEPYWPHSL